VGGGAIEDNYGAIGVLAVMDVGAIIPWLKAEDGGRGGPHHFGHVVHLQGGREEERKEGREGWRDGGMEGWREG